MKRLINLIKSMPYIMGIAVLLPIALLVVAWEKIIGETK
jgi:ABC-type methionine transport system permease subunit